MANEAVMAEIERLRSEGTVANRDIIKRILTDNPDTPPGDLADALGVKPLFVGQVKSTLNRSSKAPGPKDSGGGGEATGGKGGTSEWKEWQDNLPPQAARLYQSLLQVYSRKPHDARSLTEIFVNNAHLLQTRQAFHNWLTRYLIPQDALSRIEDEMFGIDVFGNPSGGMMGNMGGGYPGGSQPQIQYVQQPGGGGVMPMIIVPQGGGGGGYPNMTMPDWSRPKSRHDDDEDEHENKQVAELSKKVDQLADALLAMTTQPPAPAAEPTPKLRKAVVRGEDGQPLLDADGHAIYDEVPYEEGGALTASNVRDIIRAESRAQEKNLSAEEVTNIVNKAMDDRENRVSKEDIRQMIKEANAEKEPASDPKIASLEAKFDQMMNERRVSNETADLVSKAISPLSERLNALEGINNRSSLSGDQARYVHQETLANMWQGFLRETGGVVDNNLKMLFTNAVVTQLRQAGVPDELILEIVKTSKSLPAAGGGAGGGLKSAAEDFATKYLK